MFRENEEEEEEEKETKFGVVLLKYNGPSQVYNFIRLLRKFNGFLQLFQPRKVGLTPLLNTLVSGVQKIVGLRHC